MVVHGQYFCLLYFLAVCLIVILPDIPFICDTHSQSSKVKHSLVVIMFVVLADSPFNFDPSKEIDLGRGVLLGRNDPEPVRHLGGKNTKFSFRILGLCWP